VTTIAEIHQAPRDLSQWATRKGYVKPEFYKAACETGGISCNTYLYLENDTGLVCTCTYEPWNVLAMEIHRKFLKFRCSILTNKCTVSYQTTQLGVLLCGANVNKDTYACTRCNKFLKVAPESSHLITVVSIHEKVKRLIISDITISADMRIYDYLLATSVDTINMVKKAHQLVIKHHHDS
jgi:hypothetical protein